jgi:hypothetical protein
MISRLDGVNKIIQKYERRLKVPRMSGDCPQAHRHIVIEVELAGWLYAVDLSQG